PATSSCMRGGDIIQASPHIRSERISISSARRSSATRTRPNSWSPRTVATIWCHDGGSDTMSIDQDIALLSRVPVFSALSTDHVRLLAFSAVHRELRADEVLFREGDEAVSVYIVASGEIVMAHGEVKKRKILATCEPGSLIGEIALFLG